jgi:hypothetical protein
MLQLGDDLRTLSYSMITAVVTSGGRAAPILDFQMYINANLSMLNEALRQYRPDAVKVGVRFVKLVPDGAWGRNTAAALLCGLSLVLDAPVTLPPPSSKGVPAWYAQNKDAIDALVASLPTAAGAPTVAAAQAAAALPGGAPATQPADLPAEIAEQLNGSGAGAITSSVLDPGPPAPVIMAFDVADSPKTYGTSRKGGVPWVAVGGAAVVLVGALWWMGRKK